MMNWLFFSYLSKTFRCGCPANQDETFVHNRFAVLSLNKPIDLVAHREIYSTIQSCLIDFSLRYMVKNSIIDEILVLISDFQKNADELKVRLPKKADDYEELEKLLLDAEQRIPLVHW